MLVVADAGPLIFLSAIGELHLLRALHERVVVPTTVREEVVDRGMGLPGSAEVAAAEWIEVQPTDPEDPVFRSLLTTLDAGEASVLARARSERAALVLMVERRGRAADKRLELSVRGTLGLLVRAKRRGLIPAIGSRLESLVAAGFWISDDVMIRTLRIAGEADRSRGS